VGFTSGVGVASGVVEDVGSGEGVGVAALDSGVAAVGVGV